MNIINPSDLPMPEWFRYSSDYWLDAAQRAVLFTDILRKRGNLFLEHRQNGLPPVLTFAYETILEGKTLGRPVNYDLVRILPEEGRGIDPEKRPIVVIDPRAGHGPGIGGSKQDSEIGMAQRAGHPVYFVAFHPEPCPGQTLGDVEQAEVRFIEEVKKRHPRAEEPAVIGNCQAGWAVALLSADRPDVTGPVVLNGSPLSYWAGVEGEDRMRYRGGLLGGVWLVSLLSDLGKGKFDGANLVTNFEDLNPANTYWNKQYNVWANVDTEEKRYLDFEKWWNGYFIMTAEEIRFIVSNLFVGNRLEQGNLELTQGKKIDLKNLDDPILVFASKGDNITPPQQALNWIATVYGSVDEIKRHQQTIIYRVHKEIGHLGIFVSSKVAKKEHKEIIRTIDLLENIPPGLYEMVIVEKDKKSGITDYSVRFEEREIADILEFDDGRQDEKPFPLVAAVSEMNEKFYQKFVSPFVRMCVTEESANMMRRLHPLRFSRYAFSDKNPFIMPVKNLAPLVKQYRRPVAKDNPFLVMERSFSDGITAMLNLYRDIRDANQEFLFKAIYDNPLMKPFLPKIPEQPAIIPEQAEKRKAEESRADRERWLKAADKGGFPEAIIRIMVGMAGADHIIDRRELVVEEKIMKSDERLKKLTPSDFKEMVKVQSRIFETDRDHAFETLPKLLGSKAERIQTLEIAKSIADADFILAQEEVDFMDRLKKVLGV